MSPQGKRICQLAEEAAKAHDPESALRTLTELRAELDGFVRVQVARGLAAGRSFSDLARALGISRQAAHRRYRDLASERPRAPRRRLVATDPVRRVVWLAYEEAAAAGATAGSQHLLLGILRTNSDAAHALQSEGVTLDAARACGRIPDGDGHPGEDSAGVRTILRQAGRVALARGDRHLGLEQLLLAALADPDGGAHRTLTALGVTPASIRAHLGC
jgi:ATP-dependent Clp protease ATP-binding subunit ClpA